MTAGKPGYSVQPGYRGQSQVYDVDPETGAFRQPPELHHVRPHRHVCRGCGEPIEPGQEMSVTVTRAKHVITVYAHDGHQNAASASVVQDTTWQRDQSHYAG